MSVDDPITWGEVKKNPPIITNKTSGNTGGTTNYTKISPTKSYSRITTINTQTKNNTNYNTNTKVNINITLAIFTNVFLVIVFLNSSIPKKNQLISNIVEIINKISIVAYILY